MRHYATLFDSKYAAKGLAMYRSLKRHSTEPFRLHLLPLDKQTADNVDYYRERDRSYDIELYSQAMFSNTAFMPYREWCWSLASQFCKELIFRYNLPEITYLDSDLFFFSDPKPVHDEIGYKSIAIIPHRFIPEKRYLEVNGIYNVGWVSFSNTPVGRDCLQHWAANVRQKCGAETCGDQKYLDTWPTDFPADVCIIQNIGANVAPWNVGNYKINGMTTGCPSVDGQPIVFYHFHEYEHGVRFTNYVLRPEEIKLIYLPYVSAIDEAEKEINNERTRANQSYSDRGGN